MLNILIIGAKLQGVEAMYLARKAGYYIVAVDHNADAPGALLADKFILADVFVEETMLPLFREADVVLPAIEDYEVLFKIKQYGLKTGTVVLFDVDAYYVSCSKEKSNELFRHSCLPLPAVYPECNYPVILKPDGQSGSVHVKKADCPSQVEEYLKMHDRNKTVIQEYLEGASYSLEVIGDGSNFYFPQITEVITDEAYDCKRIVAPATISPDEERQLLDIGRELARRLKIKGVFDIEVISHEGQLKLLEIDARLPSQTPVSVYHSTGMNMVAMMAELAMGNVEKIRILPAKQVCLYQQIQVCDGAISVQGEHMMGACKGLKIREDFFGCAEAITDYEEGSKDWKAIIIVTGDDKLQALDNFLSFVQRMKKETGIEAWELVEG